MRDRLADLQVSDRDGVVIGALQGEVDSSNSGALRLALSERLPSDAAGLVLDLTSVRYLDSSGIHLLFELGRRLADRRQAIRLVVPLDSPVRRVLDLCAVDSVAPIEADVETALAGIRDGA